MGLGGVQVDSLSWLGGGGALSCQLPAANAFLMMLRAKRTFLVAGIKDFRGNLVNDSRLLTVEYMEGLSIASFLAKYFYRRGALMVHYCLQ
mgnify:CR=1 FL=1